MAKIATPRLHQTEVMNFHEASIQAGTLIWHGMGLGKTLDSLWLARRQISMLNKMGVEAPKFMVIVPKSAIPTWKVECATHTPDIQANMVLVPYSQLHHIKNRIKYVDIRMLIFDESQSLKAPDTNRIEHLADVLQEIGSVNGKFHLGRILCLSGTPMPNGAHELYTTWCLCTSPNLLEAACRLRDEDKFKAWKETFAQKKAKVFEVYCKKAGKKIEKSGSTHRGVANEGYLNELLKHFVHFRRVSDCLDLPEVNPNYIDLNLPDDKLLFDADIEKPEAYMALQERLARAKAPFLFDWVKDFLAGTDEQLVVFSMYTTPLRELRDKNKKHVCLITGDEDDETRAANLANFQAGRIRVLGMSFKCGSESLNLQNCCHTIYHGYPWHFAMLAQAMARTWRQGQERPTFHHFLTSGENDIKILGIVRSKEHATTKVENLLLDNKNTIITTATEIKSIDELI
jgi:SNF2 family DNA or RNA helicase